MGYVLENYKETTMKFSIFEALMLICFGASWPFAIIKTIRAKNPAGKSYLFSVLVIIGYISGCLHKILYHWDLVFYLYLTLLALVSTDLILCLYYASKRKKDQENSK